MLKELCGKMQRGAMVSILLESISATTLPVQIPYLIQVQWATQDIKNRIKGVQSRVV